MRKPNLARGLALLALTATVAAGGVVVVSSPASAAVGDEERISVYSNQLVAAMLSPYTDNGQQVVTAPYGGVNGWYAQWERVKVADSTYTFQNHFSKQCLDNDSSTTAGTPVVQESCKDKAPNQEWKLTHDATLEVWHITNVASGLDLAVQNTSAGAGFIQAKNSQTNTLHMFQIW